MPESKKGIYNVRFVPFRLTNLRHEYLQKHDSRFALRQKNGFFHFENEHGCFLLVQVDSLPDPKRKISFKIRKNCFNFYLRYSGFSS